MAVLLALGAVVIVGMVGLAIDGGLGYMNRTTLQGAADTASQAGASMLASDYSYSQSYSPITGSPSPQFTYSQIQSTVQTDLGSSSSGPTTAQAYSAFFVTADTLLCQTPTSGSVASPGNGQCLDCQFYGTATAGIPTCTGIPSTTATLPVPLVDGVEVIPTNTNATPFLGLLGINHSSQAANATSVFGLVSGATTEPYIVWYDCYSNSASGTPPVVGPPPLGSFVTYYDNKGGPTKGYQTNGTCGDPNNNDASFKGNLSDTQPTPAVVPGWLNAKGGTTATTLTPIPNGTKFLLPFVDCLGPDNKFSTWSGSCPVAPGSTTPVCGTTFNPPQPSYDTDVCVVGFVYVQAQGDCNYGSSPASTTCVAKVIPFTSTQSGMIICEPSPQSPSCGNLLGTNISNAIVVQLYH